MTTCRILAALLFVCALSFADHVGSADAATPMAQGCAGGLQRHGGCIHLDDGGYPPLYVHTLKAGVSAGSFDDGGVTCGVYKLAEQDPGADFPHVIHTSARKCPDIGSGISWGPTYTQDRVYDSGTFFFGWFDAYHADRKGKVEVHS